MGLKTSSNQWFKNIISPTGRPPFEWLYIYILCALVGYSIADLNILTFRPQMLPKKAPPLKPKRMMRQKLISSSDLRKITDRNIFNNDGLIPPPLTDGEKKGENLDGPPVLSKLPLKLLGTIVHLDPNKSIATINKSSGNESESFRVGERIESLAEITKIERRKVIFRNLATRRLEYIEIPGTIKLILA
ncbi:MAG: hypothetical protein H6625_11150 [Bdellovibrionaceae bacterium]|nr:hypothetical protein [Pseudobdellovibrionaceae bacterium]